jgi:hypothetical protein
LDDSGALDRIEAARGLKCDTVAQAWWARPRVRAFASVEPIAFDERLTENITSTCFRFLDRFLHQPAGILELDVVVDQAVGDPGRAR